MVEVRNFDGKKKAAAMTDRFELILHRKTSNQDRIVRQVATAFFFASTLDMALASV